MFLKNWLSVSSDPIRVMGDVLHSNFIFSLKPFLKKNITSSYKTDIHWSYYSRGSRFGKIIAYGIGAIFAGLLFT
tara:strand:- start:397 stop:621 length:225 start_codon:yes stop_codon:yes gene_type:complete